MSGGAKQYGLKLLRKDAKEGSEDYEYVLKVRGMTLNHDVMERQGLRYEKFKKMVIEYATTGIPPKLDIVYPNFLRPSIDRGMVTSQPLYKLYKPFVGKGIVNPTNFDVLDFGHFIKCEE